MEAITIPDNPNINLLLDDTNDTINPILEVQASADSKEAIFQQNVLYSELELDQAPKDPNKKIDWLEELDDVAFATADCNLYKETYKGDLPLTSTTEQVEQVPSRPVFGPEPPPKYFVPEGYYSRKEDEHDDLEFEEELLREFEKEEQERENRRK